MVLHHTDPKLDGVLDLLDLCLGFGLADLTVLDEGQQDPGKSLEADGLLLGGSFLQGIDVWLEFIRAQVGNELVHIWLVLVLQDLFELCVPRVLDGVEAFALGWELFLELTNDAPDVLEWVCYLCNQHFCLF